MLTVSDIAKAYAGRILFQNVSLQINRGDRLALVGPNGAGKTTLFSIILGENTPDDGRISWEKGVRIGFLPQESAPVGEESVMQLATGVGGTGVEPDWELEPKAKTILRGLAFRESDFDRPANSLSGGWVMRAHLARLLVMRPDLLLLDEPTNHLDLESLVWFQNYLKNYEGAILLISHDREFINQLVDSIVELSHQRVSRFRGNYEAYLADKAAREERQQNAYDQQQREIERLTTLANKFRAKASKAAFAQSLLTRLDRMEKIDAPLQAEKTVKFRFPQPQRSGQRVIRLSQVDFSYGGVQPVYRGLEFEAERGQRTVLVGPNGSGKSTLLKLLASVVLPESGERTLGHNVTPGYFAQYRSEMLNPKRSVLEEALDVERRPPEQLARTLLGSFLFRGDDVFKAVGVLSGGEKTRLALAKMLLDPPNLLLMDEPTTHLDMGSIDALINALRDYEGTLIFISHDVHFIRAIATTVLHIGAGKLTPYAGNYDYYLEKTRAGDARAALTSGEKLADTRPEAAPGSTSGPKTKIFKTREEKRAEAQAREALAKRQRELEKEVARIEAAVAAAERHLKELTEELERPETYADGGRAIRLNREVMGAQEVIGRLTEEWDMAVARVAAVGLGE
ncbi:MAG: ABC-F family ATP-binding cassette domain-containing protein [Verrucomicrobiales bacterium]